MSRLKRFLRGVDQRFRYRATGPTKALWIAVINKRVIGGSLAWTLTFAGIGTFLKMKGFEEAFKTFILISIAPLMVWGCVFMALGMFGKFEPPQGPEDDSLPEVTGRNK